MPSSLVSLDALKAAMEDLWAKFDVLLASFSSSDWQRRHGKDWVMRDIPYHLAYFDREVVAIPIELRGDVPPGLGSMTTMAELDAWNAVQFKARPSGQSVEESLAAMRASRDRIRAAIAGATDDDLARPAYAPLMNIGLRTMGFALRGEIMHSWSEYVQLLIRLKRDGPMPAPETTHIALDNFMHTFPMGMSRAAVSASPFALRFRFEGPGGGAWLIRGSETGAAVEEDAVSPADVEMAMKTRTFAKMWNRLQNPMLMMLTRQVRVKGFRKMGRMAKIFPAPSANATMDPSLIT
jgi:hypothetical protein